MSEREKTFREELDKLIEEGETLYQAIQSECNSEDSDQTTSTFRDNYQQWYSLTLEIIKHTLPNRLEEFKAHYDYQDKRDGLNNENYRIADYCKKITQIKINHHPVSYSKAIPHVQMQLNILKAVKDMLSSRLLDLKALVQADLFDSEIDAAKELTKKGFLPAAGAICGVIIEKHLHLLCERHNITITKKNPGISDLCVTLRSNDIIDVPQERFIMSCADIRNICDHYKKLEVTPIQIDNLLNDTKRIIDTIY